MARSARSPLNSPALWVAAFAVISLHGVGTWWIQAGWRGDRDGAHVGPAAQGGAGMRLSLTPVRLNQEAASQGHEPLQSAPAELGKGAPDEPSSIPPAGGQSASEVALLNSVYVSANELDQSPEPQPGWVLDEAAFPTGHETRLLVRVWVAADGRIDQVALVHADPPGEWASRAIEPMIETRMSAPLQAGRAVAAVLVVEIAAQDEGFH